MKALQSFIGIIVLIFGSFYGLIHDNFIIVLLSIFTGFVLLSLSKLIDTVQQINHKLLGIPLTNHQISTIINHSAKYYVDSEVFEVYPQNEPVYPLICLDQEYYIRVKVFYKYLSQQEYVYTLDLPEREPIIMNLTEEYFRGTELFKYGDQVLIKLSRLGLNFRIVKDRIVFESY